MQLLEVKPSSEKVHLGTAGIERLQAGFWLLNQQHKKN